jgi:hypothetical protein
MITSEPGWARCLKQHEYAWQASSVNK